jgi:hypothetical protein
MMACELGFIARSELKPSLRLVRAIPIDYFALNGNVAVPIGEFGADFTFCMAVSSNPMARAENDAAYMIGLEVHASKSVTPAEADKISRYLLHNIAKWSPGAAIVLFEGDTRGGVLKLDLNIVVQLNPRIARALEHGEVIFYCGV